MRYFAIPFKEIIKLRLEKHWDYLTGFVLTLYVGFGLEKYLDYFTGLAMILCVGIGLEKILNLPYWIWIDFISL